jgi:hypothetical protein
MVKTCRKERKTYNEGTPNRSSTAHNILWEKLFTVIQLSVLECKSFTTAGTVPS